MPQGNGWTHKYHAEATALEGQLRLPIMQPVERQAHAKVPEIGGYVSQHSDEYRVEGIVSYLAAHTQAAGHLDEKPGHGYNTLATSVIEDLNVLNVVTADRIVAQISIEHPPMSVEQPLDGYVPKITFLGTHFFNLRIGGFPIDVDLDLDFVGDKPEGGRSYTRHKGFTDRVLDRLGFVRTLAGLRMKDALPQVIRDYYAVDRREIQNSECTEFSLVRNIAGKFPGQPSGYVIDIPHFGKVYLATVRIEHSDIQQGTDTHKETLFDLTMLEIEMGCIASGKVQICKAKTNGGTVPGGG